MRALIYVRVSTSEQVANYSLDSQERACREHCRRQGLSRTPLERKARRKTANRPELQAMLDLCQESKRLGISAVVVNQTNRLTRSVVDHAMISPPSAHLASGCIQSWSSPTILRSASSRSGHSGDGRVGERGQGRTRDRRMKEVSKRVMWRPPLGFAKPTENAISSLEHDPLRASHCARLRSDRLWRLSRPDVPELTEHGLRTLKANHSRPVRSRGLEESALLRSSHQ